MCHTVMCCCHVFAHLFILVEQFSRWLQFVLAARYCATHRVPAVRGGDRWFAGSAFGGMCGLLEARFTLRTARVEGPESAPATFRFQSPVLPVLAGGARRRFVQRLASPADLCAPFGGLVL